MSPALIQSVAIAANILAGRTIPGFEQANYPSWEILLSALQRQAKRSTTFF